MHPSTSRYRSRNGDGTSKKKRRVDVKMDMISELPNALLLQILSLIPTTDVVSTCVLSKRWRSLWRDVSKLDYSHLNDRKLSHKFVNRFLILHKSHRLESMRLIVGSDCETADIGIWIGYAVEHGLRELELDLYLEKDQHIRLSSSIYTCKTLEVLKLKNCVRVDVPDSQVCFKSLKILNLQLVHFEDEDSVRRLFASCTNLEELVVTRYMDNVINFTIEAPSLKRLSIHDRSDGDGQRGYVINTPSLKYLSIKGHQDFEVSLENTPELREAKIIDIDTEKILLPLASSVTRLSLSLSPLEIRYAYSIVFHKLVNLELSTSKTEWCNLLVVLLLNSPNLQVLKLMRDESGLDNKERSQFYEPINVPPCLLFYLQRFEWKKYNGRREEEKKVAMYILSNAKHLKVANFTTKNFNSDVKFEMLKELAREPKASPSCQFFFE
ncbi:unnamed protein product [Thlaspi arvense]|uniref:F-box domain-containing protein n=1 Tax=Thlaspi arvense TaxID=13288 RepID=A0AAU9T666_THLAR|nr:unnamed protein product [Thlaspi arvense]